MKNSILIKKTAFISLPFLLLGLIVFLLSSDFFELTSDLSLALTIDLLLVIPLIYFITIRKSKIPKTTVIPLMVIGMLIGSYFLPKAQQVYLDGFKTYFLPLIELFVLGFVLVKTLGAIKAYKKEAKTSLDFYTVLQKVCSEILPAKLVKPFATEVSVIYYGFFKWKKLKLNDNQFSYHKESGTPVLMYAFMFIILIETFVLHALLIENYVVLTWILTGLSLYSILQVFGLAKALYFRPYTLTNTALILTYGLLNETKIDLANIEVLELNKKEQKKNALTRSLSPLGELESPNLLLKMKTPITLYGLYGGRKEADTLVFYADEPERLVNAVNQKLS